MKGLRVYVPKLARDLGIDSPTLCVAIDDIFGEGALAGDLTVSACLAAGVREAVGAAYDRAGTRAPWRQEAGV